MCLHSQLYMFTNMDKECPDCVLEAERLIKKQKFNFEKFRLESFIGWPLPFIDPRDLAVNGLYSLRNGDLTKCNFCDIIIYDWEVGDNVAEQHRRYKPDCPMVTGMSVKNIPLEPIVSHPHPSPATSAMATPNQSPVTSTTATPEPSSGAPPPSYDVPPDMSRPRPTQNRINWIPRIFQ
jgi:hypothetical protein